ncbi:MAG TPA: MopE-related protein, partial [Saprospiraceae bacterium]|nr:MopE-related protein [Saprospiraceae bacterium]
MKTTFFSIFLFLSSLIYAQTTVTWDGGGDGSTWTDAVNWDCNCLPGSTDNVVIPVFYALSNITISGNQTINELNSWASIIIQSGATLSTQDFTYFQPGSILTVNGTLNLTNCGDVWFRADGSFDVQLINNGTITVNDSNLYFHSNNGTGAPSFVNNGNFSSFSSPSFNLFSLELKDNSVLTNNNTGVMNLFGDKGITMDYAGGSAIFNNYGSFSSTGINQFRQTTNHPLGIMSFSNFINLYSSYYIPPIQVLSVFVNNGSIFMSNPATSGWYGIRIESTGSFTSNGVLDVTSQRYPVLNNGSAIFDGSTQLNATTTIDGIINNNQFSIQNAATNFYSNTIFQNASPGSVLNIANCKNVQLKLLYNAGTVTNNGYIRFDPNNFSFSSLVQSGTFTNNGVMENNAFFVNLSPSENPGIFIQRVPGSNCINNTIHNFISGQFTGITNIPVAGIYTDPLLTTPAGTLNWSTNSFTPSSAAIGLNELFLNVQKAGCLSQIVSVRFENAISSDVWYVDIDADGFGNSSLPTVNFCGTFLAGYCQQGGDCDDTDPSVYPGAAENCNDKDYDCDGLINSALPPPSVFFEDNDFDGFGNSLVTLTTCPPAPFGWVSTGGDCDDNNFNISPGAPELCDNLDNDCDGNVDEGVTTGTTSFTNGGGDGLWLNALNWNNGVPVSCIDATIPGGFTVVLNGAGECRSLDISPGSTLELSGAYLEIQGSTNNGITNQGTINLSGLSNLVIKNCLKHGIGNFNTINYFNQYNSISLENTGESGIKNFTGSTLNCLNDYNSLYCFHIGHHGIENQSGANLSCSGIWYLTFQSTVLSCITNHGILDFIGSMSGSDFGGNIIVNYGTFTNLGTMEFQNSVNKPEWFLSNFGTFNNGSPVVSTAVINLPTPSIDVNTSDKGYLLNNGSTYNNYGTTNMFSCR